MAFMELATAILLLLVYTDTGSGQVLSSKHHVVNTDVGQIQGIIETEIVEGLLGFVSKFIGIPYGESTAGVNRYRKPVPKANFTAVFNATYPKAACQQPPIRGSTYTYSEDCLFLNIYVPGDISTSTRQDYPVMIWVHGGGFHSGDSYSYPGEFLVSYGEVIMVSVNYRLGHLGFLTTKDSEAPGNYGLWDQHLAFTWVHNHIQAFGGDRNNVTIFGESAGAACALLHALYPGNNGLFQRVIAESGAALNYWATTDDANSAELITAAGCDQAVSKVDCLRSKSAVDLQKIVYDPSFNSGVEPPFRPTMDGEFLVARPRDIFRGNSVASSSARDFFASLDILTGVNSFDGALYLWSVWGPFLGIPVTGLDNFTVTQSQFSTTLVPWSTGLAFPHISKETKKALDAAIVFYYSDWEDTENNTKARDNLVRFSSDVAFFSGAIETAREHVRLSAGRSTYFYEFTTKPVHGPLPRPNWIHGANHAEEIQFVFGKSLKYAAPPQPLTSEQVLAKSMISLWTNFAKSGNPNRPLDVTSLINNTWPQYDLTSEAYLEMSTEMAPSSVKHRFSAQGVALWLSLVPSILSSTCPKENATVPVNLASKLIG